jgi:hypothetical protein
MERREFLKYGAAGVAATSVGLSPLAAMAQGACLPCGTTTAVTYEFRIVDVSARMIDGTMVNMLGFALVGGLNPAGRVPGPVLRAKEGSLVHIRIHNTRLETHGFEITGIPGTKTEIAPGCSCTVSFTAPVAGTYLYHDGYGNSPLYRILGLHGVLVVEPLNGLTTPSSSRTPYSLDKLNAYQRRVISAVFDTLGTTERLPGGAGGKWVPAPISAEYSQQERIWVLSSVDPKFNALLVPGAPIQSNPTLTSNVVANFVPRYFTINNRSGFDLHTGNDVVVRNYIGEPTLIRVVNAGLAHHAPHFHGNHVWELARADIDPLSSNYGRVVVSDNVPEVDVFQIWPMQRKDVLLPLEVPPDIPFLVPVANPDPNAAQFGRMVRRQAQEPLPLRYPMHCHAEMSQTAAGGNYPQGMVTHWELVGGVGGRVGQPLVLLR